MSCRSGSGWLYVVEGGMSWRQDGLPTCDNCGGDILISYFHVLRRFHPLVAPTFVLVQSPGLVLVLEYPGPPGSLTWSWRLSCSADSLVILFRLFY